MYSVNCKFQLYTPSTHRYRSKDMTKCGESMNFSSTPPSSHRSRSTEMSAIHHQKKWCYDWDSNPWQKVAFCTLVQCLAYWPIGGNWFVCTAAISCLFDAIDLKLQWAIDLCVWNTHRSRSTSKGMNLSHTVFWHTSLDLKAWYRETPHKA